MGTCSALRLTLLRWVLFEAQVTTPCLIYLTRRDRRLSFGPEDARIRTQDSVGPATVPRGHRLLFKEDIRRLGGQGRAEI